MDVPKYLKVLWASKWMLLIGVVVAVVAGFFAGFQIVDGKVVSRTVQQYRASTTLLVGSQSSNLYQAVVPGQALVEGQTQPESLDLTSKAILYAYIISGAQMRSQVEASVGEFADTDSLTALRRTTQPAGDESFPGRYSLPIISVVGSSTDPDRAVAISQAGATLFVNQVVADQDAAQIPATDRVMVTELDRGKAQEVEGSNPAIPSVVTGVGIFLLFVVAAFIIAGVSAERRRRREAAEQVDVPAAVDESSESEIDLEDQLWGSDQESDRADDDASVVKASVARRARRRGDDDLAGDEQPALTS